ncbi:PspC domain-containing protein [Paenibacillus sediminis]|uniref:Phage shock protein PspC (Stress-responsive transcriptional regulator) n=1 Tax=Paenibacillus sediminis TaxID=664909 RepID=A0ABS4H7F7_9BACL|nr:PspC domain-containing protein [Paenibacillus sediminis]MBP1938478.1 phage shock protein PspC (stress-responsive transcriptional regulator) [Paenibacillus sediminis]
MSKLYRSTRDRVLTGLCGGLSEVLGIDSTLLRVLFVLSIPFSGGTTLFIYFVASLIIPKEPNYPFDSFGPRKPGYPGYNDFGSNYSSTFGSTAGTNSYNNGSKHTGSSNLDAMMEDIEKKALKKEVEELRKKLSNYEKGEV